MGNTYRFRKRILIFLIIPVLTIIPYFIDDIIVKIIFSAILVTYVGFIIFLRDTVREEDASYDSEVTERDENKEFNDEYSESDLDKNPYRTDDGEDFVIISPNKKIEVMSSGSPFQGGFQGHRKQYFKPPDLKAQFEKIANEEIRDDISQDEQFGFVLEKILTVVKDAFMAHTAVFFWYNKNKNRLTLEKYVSASGDISQRKFDLENDILSKIIDTEEPEILSDISPAAEKDVIRYYSKPQGIKSFVGVPLYYGKSLAGILALDSKDLDVFGIETIYSMGRFVRVISMLISIFEQKFEEARAELRLKSLLNIVSNDKKFEDEQELFLSLEQAVKNLIAWDAFSFVYFNPNDQKFSTAKIVNNTTLKYVGVNLEVDLKDTLVGKVILTGQPLKVDDTSEKEYKRYSKSEDVSFDGAFLAIPLNYDNQYFGVICFESLKKNAYTNSDVRFMKNAAKIFSYLVYSYSTQNVLKNLLSVDIELKILNYQSFVERLESDLLKTNELEVPGALALIKIDDFIEQESLFEGNPYPKIIASIKELIESELPPIYLFGRLNDKLFGVFFFNASSKDTFLWAEKLRVKIARFPIEVNLKQTTYTVSIGVTSTSGSTKVENVLHNAELALNKALEKGGNTVKSIN